MGLSVAITRGTCGATAPFGGSRVPLLCRALAWVHICVAHVVTEASLITSAPRCSLRIDRGGEIELERGQLHWGLGLLLLHAPMSNPEGWRGMITPSAPSSLTPSVSVV